MEIVDAQVHANHRGIDQSIAIMDAVGVDAAVIDIWPPVRRKLPNGVMRFEYPFGEEAVARFPGRFAYIARFDPNDPEIDDLMPQVRKAPGRNLYPHRFRFRFQNYASGRTRADPGRGRQAWRPGDESPRG
jgi:hypothetical protein